MRTLHRNSGLADVQFVSWLELTRSAVLPR